MYSPRHSLPVLSAVAAAETKYGLLDRPSSRLVVGELDITIIAFVPCDVSLLFYEARAALPLCFFRFVSFHFFSSFHIVPSLSPSILFTSGHSSQSVYADSGVPLSPLRLFRYCGDTLAWVHQAVAGEQDFYVGGSVGSGKGKL
jgi:hypothetical protein